MGVPLDKLRDEMRQGEARLRQRQQELDRELAEAHTLMEQNAALDARLSDFHDRVMSGEITDERRLEEYVREADAQRQRHADMRAVLRRVIAARRARDAAQREYDRSRRAYEAAGGTVQE